MEKKNKWERTVEPTYGQVTFKASHNAYDRDEHLAEQLTFMINEPWQGGCLALEFDIWRHTSAYSYKKEIKKEYFTVSHTTPGSKPFSDWLNDLLRWHELDKEHLPVLVTIDIKSSRGGYDNFHEALDTYLMAYFNADLLFKPMDLGFKEDLCGSIINYGWPAFRGEKLKGKFIFCLSGNKEWKSEYANYNLLTERYCFSDLDTDDESEPPENGNFVFFNFHIYDKNKGKWGLTIPKYSQKQLITRAYVANSETNWQNSISATFSAIATDKIKNHSWASVDNNGKPYKIKNLDWDLRSLKNRSNGEYRTDHATKMREDYKYPDCTFRFEQQEQQDVFAIKNLKNQEYFDCTISSMSDEINDDCQRWKLIPVNGVADGFYIQNVKNKKYMTKRASKLSETKGNDEVYLVKNI